jgi:hypothetical protein
LDLEIEPRPNAAQRNVLTKGELGKPELYYKTTA